MSNARESGSNSSYSIKKKNKLAKEKFRENQEALSKLKSLQEEILERRERVKKYKPGASMAFSDLQFPDTLNIGLFGTTGIGKTSLLNSLKYAVNGELSELHIEQVAPADFQGGHTVRRQAIKLTKNIAFIDNRGVLAEDLGTAGNTDEMVRQLEGRSSFAKPIIWRDSPGVKNLSNQEQRRQERIYCAVLVFDARIAKAYFDVANKFVSTLHEWQGRFPIAVVTNIDRATEDDRDNMRVVLESNGIVDIYEIANITSTKHKLEDCFQLSLLRMIEKCVGDGDRIFELRTRIEGEEGL